MTPLINIKAPDNTPPILIEFTHYLSKTYPLVSTKHLNWEFQNRYLCAKGASGFAFTSTYKEHRGTTLKVALGFRKEQRPIEKLLHTIAHEYKHALHFETPGRKRGHISDAEELEAAKFAEEVVPNFKIVKKNYNTSPNETQLLPLNKYNDAYVLTGKAARILATSLSDIKGRVTAALHEIRLVRSDQLPDRELVKFHYCKLIPYMSGNLYEAFFRMRSTKLKEIACHIYALREEVAKDYRSPNQE